jgi:hypothetical protein
MTMRSAGEGGQHPHIRDPGTPEQSIRLLVEFMEGN